ncbi:MAG: hypothetical protein Q9164_006784, partial [Protoblastenia rupestris]
MAFKRFNARPTSTTSVSSSTPFPLLAINLTLRFLQFIFAIAVIGLYATDINNARKDSKGADSKWTYAVVVGALSAVTALVILWTAVFGVFGKMYINEDPESLGDIGRMKNAVWVDLVNMKSLYTGRAA